MISSVVDYTPSLLATPSAGPRTLAPAAGIPNSFLDERGSLDALFAGIGEVSMTSISGGDFPSSPSTTMRPVGRIPVGDRQLADSSNLVSLNRELGDWQSSDGRQFQLLPEATAALRALRDVAKAEGFDVSRSFSLNSAFRDDALQAQLQAESIAKHGSASASTWTAAAGGSEHRTGFAADIQFSGFLPRSSDAAGITKTSAHQWMVENGGSFGFNPYDVEPWHWSYNVKWVDVSR